MKFLGMLKPWLVCIGVILATSIDVSATTYYVSPAGKDTNSGSEARPFMSIQRAADAVSAGDTVIVKDGIYKDTDRNGSIVDVKRGGKGAAWITFKSEHKWGAVLTDRSAPSAMPETLYGFLLGPHANYIRIQDFEIQYVKAAIWANDANHDIITNGNFIHNCGNYWCHGTNPDNWGGGGAFVGPNTFNFTFDSNVFGHNGRITCGDRLTDYNHDHAIYIMGHNQTITNNVFYDHRNGWAIQLTGGTGTYDGSGWYIYNNTFAYPNDNREGHIMIWTAAKGKSPKEIFIQNNISYRPKSSFIRSYGHGDSSWHFRNNLIFGGDLVSSAEDRNKPLFYISSGNIFGRDPEFADPVGFNFHLRQNSPAIGSGYLSGTPRYDNDNKMRSELRSTVGAFEWHKEK